MNKWQKEVLNFLAQSEEDTLKALEKEYKRALNEIGKKVKEFQTDIDMLDAAIASEGLSDAAKAQLQTQRRSKIYQKRFQEALQGQVNGILDRMQGATYSTIEAYLKRSYEDSFIGTMYDIAGQGIPLIVPIDQAAAIKAVLTDSKVSKGLYNALGVDVAKLKRTIRSEISRGIATSLPYSDIARNITNVTKAPMGRAKTIVRTEGHRIQQASTMDAQNAAKARGADVVKQWDASLDSRTRETHRRLDGQIREVEEPFEIGGREVMAPGYFGDPAEDCNCRCVSLTRARWAVGDSFTKMNNETKEIVDFKDIDDYKEFKKTYLKKSQQLTNPSKSDKIFAEIETDTSKALKKMGIDYNPVLAHTKTLTTDEIIQLIAGGDMTSGSCASVALAYAGQQQGWNVLDFRGGKSMYFFSSKQNKVKMFQDLGAKSIVEDSGKSNLTNGNKILAKLEKGKEYYLSVGRHASIVRRNEDGVLQYLELQSATKSGWIDFDGNPRYTLKYRFGCSSSSRYYSTAYATDISQLTGDDFRTILGYLNTDAKSQRKGATGYVK